MVKIKISIFLIYKDKFNVSSMSYYEMQNFKIMRRQCGVYQYIQEYLNDLDVQKNS